MNNAEPVVNKVNVTTEKNEKGATMVEYAIMVALIAVVAIAAVRVLGTTISTQFSAVEQQLQ